MRVLEKYRAEAKLDKLALSPYCQFYLPLFRVDGSSFMEGSAYGHLMTEVGAYWRAGEYGYGHYFDGSDDYIKDELDREIIRKGTLGDWRAVIIGEETRIFGDGTWFYFNDGDVLPPKLTGKLAQDFAEHCTNLAYLHCGNNSFSGVLPSFAACTGLTTFYCYNNSFSGVLPSFATCTSLAYFHCANNSFSGVLPSFATCTSLANLHCYNNSFSGTLPSFAACTNLANLHCGNNSFSGTLPSFAACTGLTTFYCYTNSFSGYESGGFATQKDLSILDINSNAIAAAADINQILADLRTSYDLPGRVACAVRLEGGTNAAPTGQGITDKNFLNANGWTVITN